MSTVTGKALDCEIMSEEFRLCMPWRGKTLHHNSKNSGRDISMNVSLISRPHLEHWMLLVSLPFFKDTLKSMMVVIKSIKNILHHRI